MIKNLGRIGVAALIVTSAGCGQQKTLRDAVNTQNDSFAQSRFDEMAPAEGTYAGKVHMVTDGTEQDFPCVLVVKRKREPKQITQLQDQSETVEVIKLAGGLRFPFLEKLIREDNYSGFEDLLAALGVYSGFNFNFGNYNPRTRLMVIQYEVKDKPFGDLTGTLDGDTYTGTWSVNSLGTVATFKLTRQPASPGGQ